MDSPTSRISGLFGGDRERPADVIAEQLREDPDAISKALSQFPGAAVEQPSASTDGATMPSPFAKQSDDQSKQKSKYPWLHDPHRGVRWDHDPIALRNLAQENTWTGMLIQTITKEVAQTPITVTETDGRANEIAKRLDTNPFEREEVEKQEPDSTADEILDLLLDPNPDDTWTDFVEMLLADLLEVGSGAATKAYPESAYGGEDGLTLVDDDAQPLALKPTAPEVWTKSYRGKTGILEGFWQFDHERQPGGDTHSATQGIQEPIHFDKSELLWDDMSPRTNRRYGMPPTLLVQDFLELLNLSIAQEQQYFSKGAIPSGAWVFEEWDKQHVKEWKEENEANIKGKPHKNLMFAGRGGDVRFEPMSFNWQELQYMERVQWYARVIASVFQVPTAVVGIEPEQINYHCHTEDTEVLTEDGWKYYDEVADDDEIAVYDPETHGIQYEVPKGRVEHDIDDEIVHLGNTRTDFAVTPDHKLLYATRGDPDDWQLKPYSEVGYQSLKFRTAPDEIDAQDAPETITIPAQHSPTRSEPRDDLEVDTDTFAEFLGYFISEGTTSTRDDRYGIHFCQTDGIAERVQELYDDMGLSYKVYEKAVVGEGHSAATEVRCFDKRLSTWVEERCGTGSGDMQIPREFLDLPREHLRTLYGALIDGDGTVKSDRSTAYTTTSKQLADDVQELAFKLGYSASVALSERHPDEHADAYVVNILDDGGEVEFRRYNESITEERRQYSGTVWCFETSTGAFVTRRNGKVAIQGNTFQGERANFEENTLGPYLQKIERVINDQLVWSDWGRDYRFEFQPGVSETTRSHISQRIREEYRAGIVTKNEARRQVGYEQVDDGDEFREPNPQEDLLGDETVSMEREDGREVDVPTADAVAERVAAATDGGESEDYAGGGPGEWKESNPDADELFATSKQDDTEPLRNTDNWDEFSVQPEDVEALYEEIEEPIAEVFDSVLSDAEIEALIEEVAQARQDDETSKNWLDITEKLREIIESKDVVGEIQDAVERHREEQIAEAVEEASEDVDDAAVNAEAIRDRVTDRDLAFADALADRMSEDIRDTIEAGWSEGRGTLEIKDDIEELAGDMEGWGAEKIARQELQIAAGEARSEFADQTGKVEVWLTAGDNRVRDAHQEMDGTWKLPAEEWEVDYGDRGVQKEDVPGDSEPGIGCRCTTLMRDPDDVDPDDHAGTT